jgi:hypothetical protein
MKGHRSSRDHTIRATDGEACGKSGKNGTGRRKALIIKICGGHGHEVSDEPFRVSVFIGK